MLGLKKPLPNTNKAKPAYIKKGVSTAIQPCPSVINSAPTTTAFLIPMTLSAK